VIGESPSPEFAAVMGEQCRCLLEKLDKPELQAVALAKMEGYTNEQIAEQLECSVRTVGRFLDRIRKKWRPELRG
jgi:DNA-directed RNA polymerase specialized sigma24 family protein